MPDDSDLSSRPIDSSARARASRFSKTEPGSEGAGRGEEQPPAAHTQGTRPFAPPEQLEVAYAGLREWRRKGSERVAAARDTVHETIVSARRIRAQSEVLRQERPHTLG